MQARRDDLAQECDFATDCRAVRLPCGRYGVTSERGSLQALDSLVVWHDEYGCCDAAFDPAAIPAAPSTLHCTEAGACPLTP